MKILRIILGLVLSVAALTLVVLIVATSGNWYIKSLIWIFAVLLFTSGLSLIFKPTLFKEILFIWPFIW